MSELATMLDTIETEDIMRALSRRFDTVVLLYLLKRAPEVEETGEFANGSKMAALGLVRVAEEKLRHMWKRGEE